MTFKTEVSGGHGVTVSPSFSHVFFLSYVHIILSSYKEVSGLANNDLGKMMMIMLTTPQNLWNVYTRTSKLFICLSKVANLETDTKLSFL